MNSRELPGFVQECLRESLAEPGLRVLGVEGVGEAADFGRASTDQKWRMIKYAPDRPDDLEGVLPLHVAYATHEGGERRTVGVLMKARTRLGIGAGLIPQTMNEVGLVLEKPYPEYRTSRESVGGYLREIELYRLQNRHPALRKYLPRYLGDRVDEARNEFVLLEELVTDATLMDSADDVSGWTPTLVDTAIEGIADIHAIYYGRDEALAELGWLERRATTEDVLADESLWRGLADFARRRFPKEVSEDAHRRHLAIIDSIAEWHPRKDAMRHALVHDDFNPRNCGFRPLAGRPTLVVYDWEMALVDVPQRDLVELLVFTLSDAATRPEVDAHVERHRARLEKAAGTSIDRDEWFEGFRCELYLEAINRVPLQWLFHSRFPSGYAVRIGRTLGCLLSLYADIRP
jgi:hydroxymethylglutaryl-CoA reductase (NADPH)